MNKKKLQIEPKQVIMSPSGIPEGVVLDINDYENLVVAMEDFADLIAMESVRHEKKYASAWEDFERRLKADGVI